MNRHLVVAVALLAACEGPPGPRGFSGTGNEMDAAVEPRDAFAEADAEPSPDDASGDATADAMVSSLMGQVRDPSNLLITSGQVVLVPTERVRSLASTPIDLTLAPAQAAAAMNDEPLEDLMRDATLMRAAVNADGSYRLDTVPDGEFFVVYQPADNDSVHLPGGQDARTPFTADALRGVRLDLTVSSVPSSSARYVGSTGCLNCHARHTTFASAHLLTIRVPGVSTFQQDVAGAPRIDEALLAFTTGTTLYYFGCSGAGDSTSCQVSTVAPSSSADVRLTVRLSVDTASPLGQPGHFSVELATSASSARYPVALTLGGTRSAQQYVARLPLAAGGHTHFMLPLTYQLAGDDTRPSFADHRWVSYRVQDWLDLSNDQLRTPAHDNSFERQCAGCHATGYTLQGDSTSGFRGSAVATPDGSYDLDGDGRAELLGVGCEGCHGPGSEHLQLSPRGQRIVSPRLLTPERQTMICGTCHSRHLGKHGEMLPLDQQGHMPRAGISRSAFLAEHVSQIESGTAFFYSSGDSRLNYQQYTDFIKSDKYRSAQALVTCSSCHDSHRSAGLSSDLKSPANETCNGCHRAQSDVAAHVKTKVNFPHDVGLDTSQLVCTTCHMVKTARAGAGIPALNDVIGSQSSEVTQYYHGDRSSHRFAFTGRSFAAEQPVAATSSCGQCHGLFLPIQ